MLHLAVALLAHPRRVAMALLAVLPARHRLARVVPVAVDDAVYPSNGSENGESAIDTRLEEGARSGGLEGGAETLVGRARHTVKEFESQLVVVELKNVGALALLDLDDSCAHDLNGASASSVARRQISVHLLHGLVESNIAVLLVHVVRAASAVIAQPHAEVLDLVGVLLKDLMHLHDLASCALDLLQLRHVIPESRPRNDGVVGEDLHAEDLRIAILGRGKAPSRDLVLMHFRY